MTCEMGTDSFGIRPCEVREVGGFACEMEGKGLFAALVPIPAFYLEGKKGFGWDPCERMLAYRLVLTDAVRKVLRGCVSQILGI